MKKTLCATLAAVLLTLALVGCGGGSKDYDLEELSAEITDSGAFSDILSPVTGDIAVTFYGIDPADVETMNVYCSTGATTEEVGLFKCVDETAAGRVLEKAQARAVSQKEAYVSYAPEEVPKIEDAIIRSDGVYVFYVVANDYSKVNSLLK